VVRRWLPIKNELNQYWRAYGGALAFWDSPFLWLAFAFSLVVFPVWKGDKWPDIAIAILPPLLGLSIGAMAILLAFPSTKMFRFLSEGGRADSFYIDICSKFTHFIIVQLVALLISIFGKAYSFFPVSFLGCWALTYAILTAGAIALTLFRIAQIYNHPGAQDRDE
jgi:hypothetical protein